MKRIYHFYLTCMTLTLTMPMMIVSAFAVDDMWTVANKIIVDVYGKIVGVSTVLAGLMSAVAVIGAVGLAVGLCIQGIVSGWMDVCSIYACPIGALLAGVFFYWVLKKEDCLVQVNLARRRPLGRWFYPTAKYLYCGVTVLVLILGAVNGGIG